MKEQVQTDIFGAVRMGYILVGSRKLSEWKRFVTDGMGLHLAFQSADELAFRMDNHARRLIVQNDASEDVMAAGWQLDDETVLQVVLDRLTRRGISVEFIDDTRAATRGVECFHQFVGPKGLLIELFTQPLFDESPLDMLNSAFKTGAAGIGHMSIMSQEPERSIAFWQEIFDARISDKIELSRGKKVVLDVTFMRMNERHHSVAIAATKGVSLDMFRTRVQHLNFEAATLDDLSSAYQRCKKLDGKMARGVGQHPNDKELSFYAVSPSGFDLELGWDALTVDEDVWQDGRTYPNMSNWGHDIPGMLSSELSMGQVVQSIRSLTKTEYLPW